MPPSRPAEASTSAEIRPVSEARRLLTVLQATFPLLSKPLLIAVLECIALSSKGPYRDLNVASMGLGARQPVSQRVI